MTEEPRPRGTASLLGDVVTQLSRIIRGELALAQAEMTEGLRRIAVGLAFVVVGVAMAITALNVLSAAVVAGVVMAGLSPPMAALAVGMGFALIAGFAIAVGVARLRPARVVPDRALQGLRRDAETLKEGLTP
jgi:Putative Actinobacterial Holin-X, holin superfamily III